MASLSPFNQSLNRRQAAHLLRRASFGASKPIIDDATGKTPQELLDELFIVPEAAALPVDPATQSSWIDQEISELNSKEGTLKNYVLYSWAGQLLSNPVNIRDKMVWFFHSHFTTIQSRVRYSKGLYYQIRLFEYYATGNFKELSKKICLDTAMLFHLDGHLNVKGRPNENFAREFLELYTIGKGPQIGPGNYTNFTEQDVQEAARVLSGYGFDKEFSYTDPDTGMPSGFIRANGELAHRHDSEPKTFSEAFGQQTISPIDTINGQATVEAAYDELDQLVEMIFSQAETARHICRKLYRYFVYYKITDEVEQDIIGPLAQTLIANDYELEAVLRELLSSEHFFDQDNTQRPDDHIGGIIKSPLELVAGSLRFLQLSLPDAQEQPEAFYEVMSAILRSMQQQGLSFYEPPEVAGYPAYHQEPAYNRNWITPNNLARRYEFAARLLLENGNAFMLETNLMDYVDNPANISDLSVAQTLADEFIDYLLPQLITQERRDYFTLERLMDTLSQINWYHEWDNYQTSGDGSVLRRQIERFLVALMQAPEFQLN